MSAISSSAANLYQFLKGVSANSPLKPATPTVGADAASGATSDSSSDPSSPVRGHHHHHGRGEFFQKVQSAVTDALQSAQDDPDADPNKTIEDAIAKVLEEHGAAGKPPGTAPAQGTDPAGGGNNTAFAQNNTQAAGPAGHAAFSQLLQSLGVSPQQFHQDFLNALQDAKNGNADTATALKSLPAGSLVDTSA